MIGFLKRLRRNQRGNVLIITAVGMPMLIGMAGLATDTIQWALWKRQLQRAADSAAIAGVYERNSAPLGSTGGVADAVQRDLRYNQHAGTLLEAIPTACAASGDAALVCPEDEGTGANRRVNQVEVTLKLQKPLTFSSLFMSAPPTITVKARAASVPGAGEYCIIALDPRDVTGVNIGGSTNVDLGSCCLIANSVAENDAFTNTGNASLVRAGCIAAQGGVRFSKSENWDVDAYYPYSEPAPDPYEHLTVPEPSDCDETITVDKNKIDGNVDYSTAAAGHAGKTICFSSGFAIGGNLTLGSATYVIQTDNARDSLSMSSSGSSLSCTGCTIILTNPGNEDETGNFDLTGGAVNLSAPTDAGNPYKGVVLYQDRRAEDDGSRGANHVRGNNVAGIQGVIYTPTRSLLYNGGATVAGGSAKELCLQIVAARVEFTGNSAFKLGSQCATAGFTGQTGGGWLVRLVA